MHKQLLMKYNKAIVHMRQCLAANRFSLVFGAGISVQTGFPSWKELLRRAAEECKNPDICSNPDQPSLAQCIFQTFLAEYISTQKLNPPLNSFHYTTVKSKWKKLIIDCLYKDVSADDEIFQKKASYLSKFIPVIHKTKMTINYNFDDSLQRLLQKKKKTGEKRGYRTDWRSDIQLYSEKAVIYHPNGFLPNFVTEKPSDSIVLLDDAFGDQLIDSLTGKYTTLFNHYSQNTCLLIGLSLTDPTLQNILRRNANISPGNVHYYVKFRDGSISEDHFTALSEANFQTYNLVTLFLDSEEISALADLLMMDEADFSGLCNETGSERKFIYYITGSVAAGKSTTISFFRNIEIFDEWLDKMPDDMTKDPSLTSIDKIKKIDLFVAQQWAKKTVILNDIRDKIVIVDRCPLDAFAFTEPDKWREKAVFLHENLFPGKSKNKIEDGMVILLENKPFVLHERALEGFRETDKDKLEKQQNYLMDCYKSNSGLHRIDGFNYSKESIAKQVAKIIFLDEYIPYRLHDLLLEYRDEKK